MVSFAVAQKVFQNTGDIVKTSDFNKAGLTNYDVYSLCHAGCIERIRHGFYQQANVQILNEEVMIANLIPHGIICVESALYHYGYSDFTPRKWSIAIQRTRSRSVKQLPFEIKAYYIQQTLMSLGKTQEDFNGVKLFVYDRERTICDCFKYRTKLDSEIFHKALHAYAADDNKNLHNLALYAKEMRIYDKVMNIMEVLLNG